MLGDHHLWRKTYAYEASARIPMLLRWPEGSILATRGQDYRQPAELRDLLPTFLDAAVQLALTLYTLGRSDDAVEQWNEVLKRDPAHRDARMYLRLVQKES